MSLTAKAASKNPAIQCKMCALLEEHGATDFDEDGPLNQQWPELVEMWRNNEVTGTAISVILRERYGEDGPKDSAMRRHMNLCESK